MLENTSKLEDVDEMTVEPRSMGKVASLLRHQRVLPQRLPHRPLLLQLDREVNNDIQGKRTA